MAFNEKDRRIKLALATFEQACFDLEHGRRILDLTEVPTIKALAIAQFQQATEKALKAMVLFEYVKQRPNDKDLLREHKIWGSYVSADERLRGLQNRILGAIQPYDASSIIELEALAPTGDDEATNTEYPWWQGDHFKIPALFFEENDSWIEKSLRIAQSILQNASDSDKKLAKIETAVKEELAANKDLNKKNRRQINDRT